MDSFNQIFFNLETTLSKEEYAVAPKNMQKEKTKNLSIIYKENLFCKLHSLILEEEEFESTLILFIENEITLPKDTNPEVINVLINYFYFREIKNLNFSLIFDLLSTSIFFRLNSLIYKIINFLTDNIVDLNRVAFIARNIFPMTFLETTNPECNFRVLFDNCEKFLLKEKCLEEFFSIIENDVFNYKIDVEAELLKHIKLMKESGIEDVHLFHLINLFKEKIIMYKNEKEKNFDPSKYFESIIDKNIDIKKVDQKILNENISLLNLNRKEFEIKILTEKIVHLESEKNSLKEEIMELKKEAELKEIQIEQKITTMKKEFYEKMEIREVQIIEKINIMKREFSAMWEAYQNKKNTWTIFESKFQSIKTKRKEKLKFLASTLNFNSVDELDSKLKLLYRATENNFDGTIFHQLCDDKGPTLVLILSTLGRNFGGFANASWNSKGESISAPGSFVFTLDHLTKHLLINGEEKNALFGTKNNNGPIFGKDDRDIYIHNYCNKNTESQCDLGSSYFLPEGIKFQSELARSYMAGVYGYFVEEYEVFSIT